MNSPSVLVTGPRRPRFSVHDETLKSRIPAGCAGSPSAGVLASIRESAYQLAWLRWPWVLELRHIEMQVSSLRVDSFGLP
jgi:hypothetical protein